MFDWWFRRNWKRDPTALREFEGLQPVTLITGATRGIGLELAKVWAQQRANILLVARSESDLTTTARLLDEKRKSAMHGQILTLALDITDPSAIDVVSEKLVQQRLYVEELINNAGVGLSGNFAQAPTESVDQLVELNVTALTRLSRAFLPDMLARGKGGIVNIASLGGFTPGPYQAAYYASKAYVISLTRALAQENIGMGVRFMVIAPGPVETRFHQQMNAERAFYRRFIPAMSAASIARSTLFWYRLRCNFVVPGLFNMLMALCLSILPGPFTIPIVSELLNPRNEQRDAGREKR